MRELNFEFKKLCEGSREGSFSTRANRERILSSAATDLHNLGFRKLTVKGLKQKHIKALVKHWDTSGISAASIKNRMAGLRWLAKRAERPSLIAKSNDQYQIANRVYVTNQNKAKQLDAAKLGRITDPHLNMTLRLQAAFGLRREEAIKFSPSYADKGDTVVLKASWCKGSRAREIPVRNEAQRKLLDEARRLVGGGSMIPAGKNYVAQLNLYEHKTSRAGLSKMHGLRHQFAQDVYKELTGRFAPCVGGPRRRELSAVDKAADDDARLTISNMLGHNRINITAIYLGS